MIHGRVSHERKGAETLDRRACLALLPTVAVGRVAWATSTGVVTVLPVNFVVDGEAILFSTGPGDKLAAVRDGRRLSFEADAIERAVRTGWSVLITGSAEVVEDREEVRRVEQLRHETWAPTADRLFIRIAIEEITGRLLPLSPGGVTIERFGT